MKPTIAVIVVFNILLMLFNAVTPTSKRPHIIVIIADDVGWNDFSFHGSNQIPTPNIDALAFNGVVLNRFYTQQTCTPSRAAFLTGNYPIRSGLQGNPIKAGENRSIPENIATLPERLKELDYSTHLVGKWHLGASTEKNIPTGRGFDTHFGYWSGYLGYFNYKITELFVNQTQNFTGFDLHDGLKPQWEYDGQYSTDVFTEKSLDIIEKHDPSKPLFLTVCHLAAHTGDKGTELGVPNATRTEEIYHYITEPERRRTADIINLMDESVGKIVEKLSGKGMLENSIVVFFSDNGAQTIGHYKNYASSWPLRGLKFTLHEGGVRGSCTIYSPLLKKSGLVINELIHITDLMPTFYYAAGGDIRDLGNIDGINQWNVISRNRRTRRTELLLNIDEVERQSGILGYNGRYKLLNGTYQNGIYDQYYGDSGRHPQTPAYDTDNVINSLTNKAIQKLSTRTNLTKEIIETTRKKLDISWCRDDSFKPLIVCENFCLFDIEHDPCETKNLINNTNTMEIVVDLKKKLQKYWNQIVPQTNGPVDLKSNPSNCNNTWYTWGDGEESCILD